MTIPRPTTVCTYKNLGNNGINYQPQLVIVGFLVAINRMKRLRLSIPLWMAGFVTASRTSSLLVFWLFNSVCCETLFACLSNTKHSFFSAHPTRGGSRLCQGRRLPIAHRRGLVRCFYRILLYLSHTMYGTVYLPTSTIKINHSCR